MRQITYKILLPVILLCLAAAGLCACSKKETMSDITLSEVIEANKTENLLKHYDSFYFTSIYDGKVVNRLYVDSELYYYWESDNYRFITGEDFQFVYEDGTYYGMLLADGAEYNDWYDCLYLSDDMLEEELLEAVDDGEVIVMKTELDTEKTKEMLEKEEDSYLSGDVIRYTYKLDAKTYALLEIRVFLLHADKTSEDWGTMTAAYNVERPVGANELLERSKPETDIRTVTIVLDPNTEKEKIYTRTVRKGDLIGVNVPEGYALYEDEACTIPAKDSYGTDAHVLVFAKADTQEKIAQ